MPISRAAVIRELDRRLIEEVGIASAILMEHAGHLWATELRAACGDRPTLVLCGPGNNGGDGYVVARHLHLAGITVRAVPIFPPRSAECILHYKVCERLGIVGTAQGFASEIVVDAIFGTGQRAPMAALPAPPPGRLVALDVPTGMDADTGQRLSDFPLPDLVITIGRLKPFLFAHSFPWRFCDIGLEWVATEAPEAELVRDFQPSSVPLGTNKWSAGHVGILAGSAEKGGAAVLCALGALHGGAGLVTLLSPRESWGSLRSLPPEVMLAEPTAELESMDVLVVGPGLGRARDAQIRELWRHWTKTLVVDADGLRALHPGEVAGGPRLVTPHPGEAAALLGRPWRELEADRFSTARQLADMFGVAIYKGIHPIVAASGRALRVIPGGRPALGTGGSGDVLAGLCGAIAGRLRPGSAADLAVVAEEAAWRHQQAGEGLGVGAGASAIARALARSEFAAK